MCVCLRPCVCFFFVSIFRANRLTNEKTCLYVCIGGRVGRVDSEVWGEGGHPAVGGLLCSAKGRGQKTQARPPPPPPNLHFHSNFPQATVTVDDRHSRAGSDADDDGVSDGGRTSAEGGSSSFMCTPQSFPPTPVSRAHVMARTSQFSDDILFLARDQLRLGENLKPGVDETVRSRDLVG